MIPEAFKLRMKSYFTEGYEDFIFALEVKDAVRGVRLNTLKADAERFFSVEHGFSLEKIEYAKNGYILHGGDGIGVTPEHHAGLIYVQDPGAMAPLSAIDLPRGARVLDACAAPGGKSGQAAAMIGGTGLLVANEFIPKRAKALVSNIERLGIRDAIVTSLDTKALGDMFRAYFDLTVVDAPCSGEGMFRKGEAAGEEWSPENVLFSSRRQREILSSLAGTVKPGGYLIYSTCTYSIEENEKNVEFFLDEHPDYELCEVKEELRKRTIDGISLPGSKHDMTLTRRCYPHLMPCEGQFLALMKRKESEGIKEELRFMDASREPSREELSLVRAFFSENLTEVPSGAVRKLGDRLVILPHGCIAPERSVFLAGVLIGEIRGKTLVPSHQFFSAYGALFKRREELSGDAERLASYLRGEEIDAKCIEDSGFCSVEFLGAAIGGGKASGGRIKNHYPKGLRNKK